MAFNPSLLDLQEGRFEEACQKFTSALQVAGNQPHLSYNIALCHYRLKQYAPALKHIGEFDLLSFVICGYGLDFLKFIFCCDFLNFNLYLFYLL